MGRPRRPYNGAEAIIPRNDPWAASIAPVALKVRERQRWDASRFWTYRVPNGLGDPLTYMFVLDTVATIDPDIELRTKKLVPFLQEHKKQFNWDVITVGKVLADICDSFENVLGAKNGMLVAGRDYKGVFYRIALNAETIGLYYRVRADLYDLAVAEMDARDLGKDIKRDFSPLAACRSLGGRPDMVEVAV